MANIAFFVSNINPFIGGTERVTQIIAKNLDNIGYNTFFIYTNVDNKDIPQTKKIKINPYNSSFLIAESIKKFITTNNIQVIVVVNRVFQSLKYQHVFIRLKAEVPIKIIISLHASPDNWVNKNKFGLVLPRVYIKEKIKEFIYIFKNPHKSKVIGSYHISDKYLLLSKSYLKSFKQTYNVRDKENKLIAIPNPCPFYDSYDNTQKDNIILIVSRMQEDQKRIFVAIKIWKKNTQKISKLETYYCW